jgi:hypothetical protein
MGGLARRDFVTVDGVALIVCHEIGHGLGGWPTQLSDPHVSIEGQADYFATKDCLQQFFLLWSDDNVTVTAEIMQLCQQYYQTPLELKLCYRSMRAIRERELKFATEGATTSIFTPSTEVATELNRQAGVYPSYQCRIDTYVHAALGLARPHCWYPEQ